MIRLFVLTTVTMIAFAANSILNRLALTGGHIDPGSFLAIRLAAGAVALCILAWFRGGISWRAPGRLTGTCSLVLYVVGFSYAYVSLDAGLGALVLFGGVQMTMFAGAALSREAIPSKRLIGGAIAFLGLCLLVWPGSASAPDTTGVALMSAAAVGWGLYSLNGRGSRAPLADTAANFALATPVGLLVAFVFAPGGGPTLSFGGVFLAMLSGAVTSGLGYALWYSLMPKLGATRAAVSQLTVPVIALAAGAVLLGEQVDFRTVLSAMLVLGGVAFSVLATGPSQRTRSSSGS